MEHRQEQYIDLMDLAYEFLKNKYRILSICVLGAFVGFSLSYALPITYKSSISLLPVEQGSEANSGGMLSGNIGNIASLAGVNIGGQSEQSKINLEIIKSRKFILEFISKYNLEPELIAGQTWSRVRNKVEYDKAIFDVASNAWKIEDKYNEGQFRFPTPLELYNAFSEHFSASMDSDSGVLTLSITFISPTKAQEWLSSFVAFANENIRQGALNESQQKINYLEQKIENTNIESIRNIFFQLIESELQTKMLIDTREDFAYKVIDPAFLPEEKVSPKRVFFFMMGFIVTLFLTFLILIFNSLSRKFVNSDAY